MGNRYIMMGLIPFISKTTIGKFIIIDYEEKTTSDDVIDKWNNWVFTIDFDGYFTGQELSSNSNLWSSLEAVRITPEWKIEMDIDLSYGISKFILENETITGFTQHRGCDALIVKSINEHFSIGGFTELSSSYYNNIKMAYELSPAVEYNLFPYSESTRKQLRFLYKLNGIYNTYNDTTLYNKMEEILYGQSLGVALSLKQPWGSISTYLKGSHYFHDLSLNRLYMSSNLSFRLFKGFSVNLYGSAQLIHNQVSLPKEGASDEDVLLRQKQLATQYQYFVSFGVTYTFGSIYNNIVNPRFGN